jgi:hypothetical protein
MTTYKTLLVLLAVVLGAPAARATLTPLSIARRPLGDDIAEVTVTASVGSGPYDRLGIHRVVRELAPFVPASTQRAVVLLHGDFATFDTNFQPVEGAAFAAAKFLATRGFDVWGIDRRWTFAPAGANDASLAAQGVLQALADTREVIGFVRASRGDLGAPALIGWSRGAQLAYAYAIVDGQRPPDARTIDALVPLDIYYDLSPSDASLRQAACDRLAAEQQQLASGTFASPNDFQITLAQLDETAPNDPSPLLPPSTNRQALLMVVAQSYLFAPLTDWYHFAAGRFDATGNPIGLAYSRIVDVDHWFADAPPIQSQAELTDGDAIWCGRSPIAGTLHDVAVPLLYVGAGGGFGTTGLYSTREVSSRDVQTVIIDEATAPRLAFGHADMLFSPEAATQVWQPIANWLGRDSEVVSRLMWYHDRVDSTRATSPQPSRRSFTWPEKELRRRTRATSSRWQDHGAGAGYGAAVIERIQSRNRSRPATSISWVPTGGICSPAPSRPLRVSIR